MIPGYFLFNEVPTTRTFIGVACIIAAGIYIYMRERVRDQFIATETPVRRWARTLYQQLMYPHWSKIILKLKMHLKQLKKLKKLLSK